MPGPDNAGNHHVTAELADFQNDVAYLIKDDGHIVHVPLAKLSKADQAFIHESAKPINVLKGALSR